MAGCSLVEPVVGPATNDDEGGMGLPQQFPGETYDGEPLEGGMLVHVAQDGCVYLIDDAGTHRVAIWPAGSSLTDPVRLPDGTELGNGASIEVVGRVVPVERLPGGPDGYWGMVTGFCDLHDGTALVVDEVSAVR